MRSRLAIVMPNYRTADLTIDCLSSLDGEIDPARDCVIVVENGSKDGSAEQLEKAIADRGWQGWVRVLRSPVNLGFPAGCNLGLRAVEAENYMLLNNDTLVRKGAIRSLMQAAERHPDVGVVTPRLEDPDGTPQTSCFYYRSPLTEFLKAASTGPLQRLLGGRDGTMPVSDAPTEAEWVCFACVLIRGEVINQIGLLEDGYFLYFDDIDYCRRAWKAGWHVLYWPEARIVHLVGKSNPLESLAAARKRKPYYYYASRSWYFAKFYGRAGLLMANLLWTAGRAISFAREMVGNKQPHACDREWLDIWTNFFHPFKPPKRWEAGKLEETNSADLAPAKQEPMETST